MHTFIGNKVAACFGLCILLILMHFALYSLLGMHLLDALTTAVAQVPTSVALSGHVVDSVTKLPIPNCRLEITNHSAFSDSSGAFLISGLSPTNYKLEVSDNISDFGLYHNRSIPVVMSRDTSVEIELIPLRKTQLPQYSTLLEMLKRVSRADGRHADTLLHRWPTLPIPVYVPPYLYRHFGVDIDFNKEVRETISQFEHSVNALLPSNRPLSLFRFVDSEIGAGHYGVDVMFSHTLTFLHYAEYDTTSSPKYAELHVRYYSAGGADGLPKTEALRMEIRNALFAMLVDCNGNGSDFWGKQVQFIRTQSDHPMNEDIVSELTSDHYSVAAIAYSLAEPLRDLATDQNESNRCPFVVTNTIDTVYTDTTVDLDASQSFDPDGDTLAYSWKQLGGPATPIARATSPRAQVILPRFNNYTFEVTVTDGKGCQCKGRIQAYGVSDALEPKEVRTVDDTIVATYYITGWGRKYWWPPNINNGIRSSDFTLGFPLYHNILGPYDTGDPRVADWHIKMALEHGVNTFMVSSSLPTFPGNWGADLEEGLFKAKYFDKIRFMMFLNTEPWWGGYSDVAKYASLDKYIEDSVAYYSNNYFNKPNHLKIDGRVAFLIYHMGIYYGLFGQESLEFLINKIRTEGRKNGIEMFLIGDAMLPGERDSEKLKKMLRLFDGISSYAMYDSGSGWQHKYGEAYLEVPYQVNIDGYVDDSKYYADLCRELGISFIPPATLGGDWRNTFQIGYDKPYIYHTDAIPLKFGRLLSDLKQYVDQKAKMLLIYAWNEFHEANVLEPTEELGYQYLDQVKLVFGVPPADRYVAKSMTIPVGGAGTVSSFGGSDPIQVGYASADVSSGNQPYGTAVISFAQNNVTVSEIGVPAAPPAKSGRIFIDHRFGAAAVPGRIDSGLIDINTGLAILNRNSTRASVTYTLRNEAGAIITIGHGTVTSGTQHALFIDQLKTIAPDFNLPFDFSTATQFASLEISSDEPLSIIALRQVTNQRNEVLFTTTPFADLDQPPSGTLYFAQFADGGGYTTSLILLNTSLVTEAGTFQILDDNGMPLYVNQAGGPNNWQFRYNILSGGFLRFQTDGSPAGVHVGWVRLMADGGTSVPVGAAVFSNNPEGVLITESGVPATAYTTHARIYVDLSGGHNTGLAIANVTGTTATITLQAFLSDGATAIGSSHSPLELVGGGHIARFADQFISGLPPGFTGVLDISSTTPFAALTLRSLYNERHDFLMTMFPIADATRAAPSPIVFPQIADGGGYVTQFILLSPAGATSTTLSFYNQVGVPLPVGK